MPAVRRSTVRVIFVCLGNICRSPLAEGLFRHHVAARGLEASFVIDSAGTGAWHAGEPPDPRMRAIARSRGISIDDQRARQFTVADLAAFDAILVMDQENLAAVRRLDRDGQAADKVALLRDHDPVARGGVPDPYYGGDEGFEEVYRIVDRSTRALLDQLITRFGVAERP